MGTSYGWTHKRCILLPATSVPSIHSRLHNGLVGDSTWDMYKRIWLANIGWLHCGKPFTNGSQLPSTELFREPMRNTAKFVFLFKFLKIILPIPKKHNTIINTPKHWTERKKGHIKQLVVASSYFYVTFIQLGQNSVYMMGQPTNPKKLKIQPLFVDFSARSRDD